MPNHGYESKYVVCPYYNRHDGYRICCEGTNEQNTISLLFGDPKEQKAYSVMYCNSMEGHRRCLLFRMFNTKYGVKEHGL